MRIIRITLVLCLVLLLLSACGGSGTPQPQPAQSDSSAAAERPAGMDSVLPGANQTKPERTETTDAPENGAGEEKNSENFKIAYRLIGAELSDLIDKLGEPLSAEYSPSCLGSGEDGELKYEGFTVYTYKDGDREVIQDVIK